MPLSSQQMQTARRLLADPATFGTVAAGLFLTTLGEDCLGWDPVVLEQAAEELFGPDIRDEVLQRVQAVSVLLETDRFFTDPGSFHAVCAVLLDPDNDPGRMMEPPLPVELAWACTEARLLYGDAWKDVDFHPDVARYAGVALEWWNYAFPPEALSFADFTGRLYPGEEHADEQQLMLWTQTQEKQVGEVDRAVELLTAMLNRQLLELRGFGGDEKAFALLEKQQVGLLDDRQAEPAQQAYSPRTAVREEG